MFHQFSHGYMVKRHMATTTKFLNLERALAKGVESINKITGDHKLNDLKQAVSSTEVAFNQSKNDLVELRRAYEDVVKQRSQTQAEINLLLQRKTEWNEKDVKRCTEYYTIEHSLKQAEKDAKSKCIEQELIVDSQHNEFLRNLRRVYSEENAMANKSRVINSYVTWGLIALNSSIFLVSMFFIEPHKRRKFEERFQKVVELENRKAVDMLLEHVNVNKRENQKVLGDMQKVQNIKNDKSDAKTGRNSTPQIMNRENVQKTVEQNSKENVQGRKVMRVTNDQIVAFCVGAISAILLSAALG